MNNTHMRSRRVQISLLIACLLMLNGLHVSQAASDPLARYYDNTLFCQIRSLGALCRIWIDPNGYYTTFYDHGTQSTPADVNKGPWQFESQEGRYTLKGKRGAYQLCLTPNPQPVVLAMASKHLLYAETACYELPEHNIGDKWIQRDSADREYTLWLLKNR